MVKQKWKTLFSNRAKNDAKKIKKSNLKSKVELLLDLIETDPLQAPPPVKNLVGDFEGYYSRRINIQHRLVYSIDETTQVIKIISMWHHYDD